MRYETFQLGDLVRIKHGFAFKSAFFEPVGEDLVLTPGNFRIGGGLQLRPGKDRFYSGPFSDDFRLKAGDLLIAMTDLTQGAPILGSPLVIPETGRYLHNQRLGKVVDIDESRIDRNYLYFLFVWDGVRAQIRGSATGATVRHTAPERVYRVSVPLPPLVTQRRIASILSAYDDLLENNRRRISLVAEIVARLYREWFVDFRYPGHDDIPIVERDSRALPDGWRVRELREVGKIEMGQSPPSTAYNTAGDGLPFHQGVGTFGEYSPVTTKYSRLGNRLAGPGDVLLSVRAPVGRLNVADCKMILGRGLCGIRGVEAPTPFLLYALKQIFQEEDSMGGGSIFNAVTRKDVERIPIVWPHRTFVEAFAQQAQDVNSLIGNLVDANRALRDSRDFLLPRLISGTVRVDDLPIPVEEAAA